MEIIGIWNLTSLQMSQLQPLQQKKQNHGFDNSSHCIKQKMRCDKQPFLNIPLNHLVVDELYLMLRATDNNEMLTGKLVANTTGQVS